LNVENNVTEMLAGLCGCAVRFPTEAVLIELAGADARSWLQGQITQDLRKLDDGGLRFCMCEPTGQMLADAAVWPKGETLLVALDPECADAFLRRVERMVILEEVMARRLDFRLHSIQGPMAREIGSKIDLIALPIDRSGVGGIDVWLPTDMDAPSAISELPSIGTDLAEIARIEAGIPRWGADMGPRTLPPEMGPAFEASRISYEKGCYTGQEVLMRIHSRGHTNRTWTGLVLEGPAASGDRVTVEGREIGWVTSACESPRFGPIALAMLRNEALSPGGGAAVDTARGAVLSRFVPLPFGR
jgi:folate-binding protein YgfZ